MHASKIISFLALAASVVALPAPVADDQGVVIVTELVTKYVTAGVPEATPAPSPVVNNGGDAGKQIQASPTAAAAAATSAASTSSGSTGTGYMAIVNKWRGNLGLSDLTQSSKLEANDLKTVQDGNGQMQHELNPGTSAQVLGPGACGDMGAFEKVFVGGWLCEIPTLPGLGNGCQEFGAGWAQTGETGHADILTSSSYGNIGCACAEGIWGCDLS